MKTNKFFLILGIFVVLLLSANLAVGIISVRQSSFHVSHIVEVMKEEERSREQLASQRQEDILGKLSDLSSHISSQMEKFAEQSADDKSVILSAIDRSGAQTAQKSSEDQAENQARLAILENRMDRSLLDTPALVESAKPAVVQITVTPNTNTGKRLGAGFLYDRNHVLTVFHLVDSNSPRSVSILFEDGTLTTASVVKTNSAQELALLKLPQPKDDITPLRLADPATLKQGQPVVVLGHPEGWEFSATSGIISSLGRTREHPPCAPCTDVIQINTAGIPGYSGGPVLNAFGETIGMVIQRVEETIAFAVSVQQINAFVLP